MSQSLTVVELNCENLFDCRHDSLKQDTEWLPAGQRHWTPGRYWRKLNHIGQEILSCQSDGVPDLVALVEVENDTCLFDLTRRSLLRTAGYEYLMTQSPDVRGIDVALLYQPLTFRPLCYDCLDVPPREGMRPTRDILYVQGETLNGDTLHVFVLHAPSRFGGEKATRPNRQLVADRVAAAVRRLPAQAQVIVTGDFNDAADDPALLFLQRQGLHNVTAHARGLHAARRDAQGTGRAAQYSARRDAVLGTYRWQGRWQSIDHVLVSSVLLDRVEHVGINDAPFLLEPDTKYGGVKPLRTFNGYRYRRGFSDHLPLVVRFRSSSSQDAGQTWHDRSARYRSAAVLTDATTLYRICNTRPQRLSPQHGSKYERTAGGRSALLSQRSLKPLSPFRNGRSRLESAPFRCAASCLYYVYALRHIIR